MIQGESEKGITVLVVSNIKSILYFEEVISG